VLPQRQTEYRIPFSPSSEKVLLIDDEDVVIAVMKQALEFFGYTVEANKSSIEAVEVFRKNPDHYDLVITDMTMPGITGDKVAKELIMVRPDIPIILFTGYSDLIDENKAKALGIKEFVMKPIDSGELAEIVRKVLDKR